MRRFFVTICFFVLPAIAQAACTDDGYTVVYLNGIRTDKIEAAKEETALKNILGPQFNGQSVVTILGYNQTHLAGLGDVVETALPQFDQYDLDTILRNLHDQVQTRKMLIVGYSEGAMYANRLYDYLIAHGEPKDSIAIYGIATPETILQDKGRYLNYQGDTIIYNPHLQVGAVVPPPWNASVKDWANDPDATGDEFGHGFVDIYLSNFGQRISDQIRSELYTLRAVDPSSSGACFDAPDATISHRAEGIALAIGEPFAQAGKLGIQAGAVTLSAAVGTYTAISSGVGTIYASIFPSNDQTNNKVTTYDTGTQKAGVALLHALNLTSLTPEAIDELSGDLAPPPQKPKQNNDYLGGAAILAFEDNAPEPTSTATSTATTTGEVLGTETEAPPPPAVPIPQLSAAPILGGGGGGASDSGSNQDTPASVPDVSDSSTATSTDIATTTEATSTPTVLTPPQNITFSNVASPPVTDSYCDVMARTADVSWDPVPGATSYQVWQDDAVYGSRDVADTASTSVSGINFGFGLLWGTQITLSVVALDGQGQSATTSINAQDAWPDRGSPSVASLVPAIGATNVPLSTPLQLVYSKALDPSTVTDSRIGIVHYFYPAPATGTLGEPVAANVSLEADAKTVDIVPQSPLLAGQTYSMFASCAVKDMYGNHAGPLTFWSFQPQFMTANEVSDNVATGSPDAVQ